MKVLNRDDFLKLPEGTIFVKGESWSFDSLSIKGDSIHFHGGNDFFYLDPHWVEANGSGEAFNCLDKMIATGCSYPMQSSFGRDALFDYDAIFMVFEHDDLLQLQQFIETAISKAVQ